MAHARSSRTLVTHSFHLYFWRRRGDCHRVSSNAVGCACVCARPRPITSDVDASGNDDDDVRAEDRLIAADERQQQPRRDPEDRAGETLDEDTHERVDVQPVALRVLVRRRPGQAIYELW